MEEARMQKIVYTGMDRKTFNALLDIVESGENECSVPGSIDRTTYLFFLEDIKAAIDPYTGNYLFSVSVVKKQSAAHSESEKMNNTFNKILKLTGVIK